MSNIQQRTKNSIRFECAKCKKDGKEWRYALNMTWAAAEKYRDDHDRQHAHPKISEADAIAKMEAFMSSWKSKAYANLASTFQDNGVPLYVAGTTPTPAVATPTAGTAIARAVDDHLAEFKNVGPHKEPKAKNTIEKRDLWFGRLKDYATKHKLDTVGDWTKEHMRDFWSYWMRHGVTQGTASKVNPIFGPFWGEVQMPHVYETIPEPKKYRRDCDEDGEDKMKFFEPDELVRIEDGLRVGVRCLGIYGKDNPTRVRAFVYLQRYTGLRVSDMCKLKVKRINFSKGSFRFFTAKTGKGVWLPLPKPVLDAVQAWMESPKRPKEWPYVFWSGIGDYESSRKDWDRTLRKLGRASGVHISSHKFRHTVGMELAANDVSDERIADILGDTVAVVKRHYRHHSDKYQKSISEDLKTIWPADWR
jgi:Phage integrase family